MISRVTMHKIGLADYLLTGAKKESSQSRNEKDNVISLYGDLEQLKKAEQYCEKYKNWKNNYEHITIGFSEKDIQRLEELSAEEYKRTLRSIAKDYVRHRCSGYDIENEIIAYSEAHEPKLKNENGKKRLLHLHIGISYLNPLSDTKVRTTFYNNSYISDTLDKYVAKKHNLTAVTPSRIKEITNSNWTQYKQQLQEELSTISSRRELLEYFTKNKINYREIKTKNNHYFKVINKDMKDINLRGKGFTHLTEITSDGHLEKLKNKSLLELENILLNFYTQRSKMINERRSKKTKEKLEEIHRDRSYENEMINRKKSYKYQTYQQKIFMANYDHMIENQLKGYFVGESSYYKDSFVISNKSKSINIIDKGDEIVSTKNTNELKEEVRIMLEIALAKGWDLADMDITGDDEFVEESQRQIARILLEKESEASQQEKDEIIEIKQERPTSFLNQLSKENQEKIEKQNAGSDISIKELKLMLPASRVLQHAVNKYKLNAEDFEITNDNKINKKTNRKKPKTIIDFLIEEIYIDTKTAITMCRELFEEQKEEFVKSEVEKHKKEPVELLMDMDIPIADSEDDEKEKLESKNDVSLGAKPEEEGMLKSPKSSNLKL